MWRYRIRCDRAIARKPRCEQEHRRQSTRKKFGRHKRRRHDACALRVRHHEFHCPQREHGEALAEPLHSRWKTKMMLRSTCAHDGHSESRCAWPPPRSAQSANRVDDQIIHADARPRLRII
jgi:hypothetical protein